MGERRGQSMPPITDDERRLMTTKVLDIAKQAGDYKRSGDIARTDKTLARLENIKKKRGRESRILDTDWLSHENREGLPTNIHLEPEFSYLQNTPEFVELSENPTHYIEDTLPFLYRGPKTIQSLPGGTTIRDLAEEPYDLTRVRLLTVGTEQFVVKRADPRKSNHQFEEFEIAREASAGGVSTPRPVGTIEDKGNTYFLFEYVVDTVDVNEFMLSNELFNYKNKPFRLFQPNLFIMDDMKKEAWSKELANFSVDYTARMMCAGALTNMCVVVFNYETEKNVKLEDEVKFWSKHFNTRFWYEKEEVNVLAVKNVNEALRKYLDVNISLVLKSEESFAEICLYLCAHSDYKKIEEACHLVEADTSELINRYEATIQKYIPGLERKSLGASFSLAYNNFLVDTQQKMSTAGIKHKDLERRNILVKIDEYGKLIPDEKGDAQFYVIDWEQK